LPESQQSLAALERIWGSMTDSVDKSCWGITAWAIAIMIGAILAASLFAAPDQSATIAASVAAG